MTYPNPTTPRPATAPPVPLGTFRGLCYAVAFTLAAAFCLAAAIYLPALLP